MKKFYIVLYLLCSGIVYSADLSPARQILVQQREIAKDGARFVVDLADGLKAGADKVEYVYRDVVIGKLLSEGGFYIFAGEAEHDFRFINMPQLDSLKIISGGSLLFDGLVQAKNYLSIFTPKTVIFGQGFMLREGRAFVRMGAERLELFGASQAKSLLLEVVKDLTIKKDASLKLSFFASSKALNMANYGTLRVLNSKNISLSTLINNGNANFANGSLSIESFDNRGVFKAAIAHVGKKWLNSAKGEVSISLSLRTEGEIFDDRGRTVVGGLASISAIRGSISKILRARKAVIAFENETALPKSARLEVQEHLTLYSGDSLNLYGDIIFQDITEFASPTLTGEARMRYGRLKPGVVISAKQNLRKEGRVEARGNIVYSAGKAFISKYGTNKTGVFNNSLTVLAESVSIHDTIKSSSDALLFASNDMDLDGEHFIDNALVIESKLLHQQGGNKIMTRSILSNSDRAMLEGSLSAAKIVVRANDELETAASFKLDAKRTMLDAELAQLGGNIKGDNLQVKANKITEYKSLSLDTTNCTFNADVIRHEKGSLHNVREKNVESAHSHIDVENGAQVKAQDNIYRAKSYIWNAGGISSARSYLGDTERHFNLLGAKITSPNIRIHADHANINLGMISGEETKINTALNFNKGIIRGGSSLHINALLANIDAGMTISANRNVASLINISPYSLNLTDLSLDTQMANLLSPANLMRGGISAAKYAGMSSAVTALQAAQFAYNLANFSREIYQFATEESHFVEDYWRMSRIAERASRCASLAKQAHGIWQTPQICMLDKYFETPSDSEDKKSNEESLSANARSEKLNALAWKEMVDLGRDFVGGSSNVTSLLHWDQGVHVTGQVSRHTVFDYDDSLLTMSFSKDIKTCTGYDHSNSYGYTSNNYAMSDYHVGEGQRHMLEKYSVLSDGELLVGAGGNTKASEVFLSGQKSRVEAGANLDTDKFTQCGKDDAFFDGNLSAQAVPGSVRVHSENGPGSIGDNAQITLKKTATATNNGSSSSQSAPAVNVSGNTSRISGAISSEVPGLTMAAIGTAEVVQGNRSKLSLPDGHLYLKAKHVDVENGSSTIAASRHIQSETFKLSGFSNLSGTDCPFTVVGNGEAMPEVHVVAPNSAPKENNPDGKDATYPEASAVFQGNVRFAGTWEVADGILLLKPITKKDQNGDTPEDTPPDPSQRITLASGLKLISKGKLIAINEGIVVQEENAQSQAEDIIFHGDAGTYVNGINRAKKNFSATSKGDVVEGAPADTEAGEKIEFIAGCRVFKEEGSKTNAPTIIWFGEKGGELAGVFTAGQFAMFTHNTGELKIFGSTKGKAEEFIIGSFPKADDKTRQEQTDEPLEVAPLAPNNDNKSIKNKDKKDKKAAAEPSGTKTAVEESPTKTDKFLDDAPLPPIEGSLNIEEGASFDGKVMILRDNGVNNLNDLFTQTGHYKNFNISDYLSVHTDKSVEFSKDGKSASRSFVLHTNEIKVTNKAKLKADEILILHSINHDLWLGHGVSIAAGVYLEVKSDHDIVGDFKKKIITHRDYRQTVKYKGVILAGGSGLEYEYTDPKTGEVSIRRIGLNVDAKGRIKATGLKILTPPGVDARVRGKKEINNKAASQVYVKEIKKKSNKWRDKTKTYYDTEFLMPSAAIGGKLILESEEGGLNWQAGEFIAGEGADLLLHGDVNLLPVEGKKGKITEWYTLIPVFDSEQESVHGLKPAVVFINQSDTPVRIWTTKKHEINAPGFTYVGEKGTLSLRGRKGIFARPKVKHSSSSSSLQSHIDASLFSHWKSLNALSVAKDFGHNLANQNWDQAIYNIADPHMSFGIDWTRQNRKWESLGTGSIKTKDLEVDFSEALIQDNAYSLDVNGEMDVGVLPYWYQGGAKLKYTVKQVGVGGSVGLDSSGPYVEGHIGASKRSGHNVVAGQNNIGTFKGNVVMLEQDDANMHIGTLAGRIDNVLSTTEQDQSATVGAGASIKWSAAGINGSANIFGAFDQRTTHRSGISVGEVTSEGGIGEAWLEGAKISGVTPDKTISTKASKNTGVSAGLSINKDKNMTMSVGVSQGDVRLDLSLPLNSKESDEETKPWTQIGNITVKGVSLPLITSVNKNFFAEFGKDLKTISKNIIDTVSSLTSKAKDQLPLMKVDTNNKAPSLDQIKEESIETLDNREPVQLVAEINEALEEYGPFLVISDVNKETPSLVQTSEEDIAVASVEQPMLAAAEIEESLVDELAKPQATSLIGLTSPGVSTSNPLEMVNKVENVFNGIQPKPMFAAPPAYITPQLEILKNPLVFEGTTFKYKVAGRNFFLENASQLGAIEDFNKLKYLRANKNQYIKRACKAACHPEMAVFFYDSAKLGQGQWGEIFISKELQGLSIGQKTLDGIYIKVATNSDKLGVKPVRTMVHEGSHKAIYEKTSGCFEPGEVAGNYQLTAENRANILENYAHDLKMFKEKYPGMNLSAEEQQGIWHFYNEPVTYFRDNFAKNLARDGSISQGTVDCVLEDVDYGMVSGKCPSKRIAEGHSFGSRDIDLALIEAEKIMITEIYSFATEGEYAIDGFMKRFAPNTHEWFDAYFDKRTFNFRTKPLNQPLIEKTKLVAVEKIPKKGCGDAIDLLTKKVTNNNSKPQGLPASAPAERNAFLAFLHNPLTKTGIIFLDAGLHILAAGFEFEGDPPMAITEGTINTVIDAGVYGCFIGGVGACAGGPAGICVAGACIAAEFSPDIPKEELVRLDTEFYDAARKGGFLEWYAAKDARDGVGEAQVIKTIFKTPRHIADWTREQFDNIFPNLPNEISTYLYGAAIKYSENFLPQINKHRRALGQEPMKHLTSEEFDEEIRIWGK